MEKTNELIISELDKIKENGENSKQNQTQDDNYLQELNDVLVRTNCINIEKI